jgi:hypothetical protein
MKNGDLEIKNIRVEDEGFYVCSVSDNKNNLKYTQAELNVLSKVTFLTRPFDQEIAEGNSVEFFCSANGKPEPMITWFRNGIRIDDSDIKNVNDKTQISNYEFYQNNQLLKINDINYHRDNGIYTCKVKNKVNELSTDVRLNVKRPISPYFTITQKNISVYEDHPITLECFAEGMLSNFA